MPDFSEDTTVQHDASLYRELREFERFICIYTTSEIYDRGLIEDVHRPIRHRYAIWGKIRAKTRFEVERPSGVFDDGSMIFEFSMPLRSRVPQVGDFIEAHGVISRQPRMRFLVRTILPQLSPTIGVCEITPVGNKGEEGGS